MLLLRKHYHHSISEVKQCREEWSVWMGDRWEGADGNKCISFKHQILQTDKMSNVKCQSQWFDADAEIKIPSE